MLHSVAGWGRSEFLSPVTSDIQSRSTRNDRCVVRFDGIVFE
ncbi:hypothetical protein TBK1r_58690 [Stieleria magnilauensis]|uniref:Uncharacterized protein n=1 Tax=Stieleria magnilauensis TaxID=2527963 RepID=A0ABX5Y426_9BACT|nr:hypothetical protein TBK1r_58690 [Planctomycetes bacterium TBK1r]